MRNWQLGLFAALAISLASCGAPDMRESNFTGSAVDALQEWANNEQPICDQDRLCVERKVWGLHERARYYADFNGMAFCQDASESSGTVEFSGSITTYDLPHYRKFPICALVTWGDSGPPEQDAVVMSEKESVQVWKHATAWPENWPAKDY